MADPSLPEVKPAADVGDAAGRLVARVQAWQHRHPLARRVALGEIAGLGVIALPYGTGLNGQPQALFHQPNLLPGLSHRDLVAFADRHAVAYRPGAPDWPQRAIERSDASAEPAPETRHLLTAAIGGAQPQRVLIAPESSAIWGRRAWSRPRVAIALAGVLFAVALGVLALKALWQQPAVPAVTVPAVTVPAAAVPAASVPAAAPVASAAPVAAPASVEAVPAPVLVAKPTPAPLSGTHYALVSAPVKKREMAEATLERVRKLLGPAIGTLQAQVMPSPEGFVVTIWPLPTEADAERLAEVLARRGVPMKWLEF